MKQSTRLQTKIEEFYNSITHGFGVLIAIPAIFYLIYYAFNKGDSYRIVGFSIYGFTLILIFILSSIYHGVQNSALKKILNKLDHAGIFIFIAGSYTPFFLVTLRNGIGLHLLIIIWIIAIIGVILELTWFKIAKDYTLWICLIMGWMALLQLKPLVMLLPFHAILFLICGGLSFTLGTIFFKMDHIKYAHNIWHLFVLGGSGFHYVAMYYI
jgi:hemolysin III